MPVKFDSDLEQQWLSAVNINKRSSVVLQELNDDMLCLDSQPTGHMQDMPEQSSKPQIQNEFQFTSIIASPLGKRPRQPRLKRTVTMVGESLDFSVRRMTHSCAKRTGMKPTSAISIKPAPLRRPKAKKLKFDSAPCQDNTFRHQHLSLPCRQSARPLALPRKT